MSKQDKIPIRLPIPDHLTGQRADVVLTRIIKRLKRSKARDGLTLRLTRVSGTKSAEMRTSVRVATDGIRTRFGREKDCRVLNVSDMGLAVLCSEVVDVGSIVDIELRHDDRTYAGKGKVMSVFESGPGEYRYGVCCDGTCGDGPDELRKALPRISMQLKLLAPDSGGR